MVMVECIMHVNCHSFDFAVCLDVLIIGNKQHINILQHPFSMTSVEESSEYTILGYKKRIQNVPNFIQKNRLNDLNYKHRNTEN